MNVRVVVFARVREICGVPHLDLELREGATARECFQALTSRHPRLEALEGKVMVALNERYADWDAELSDGDEVALIPPVSGG